MNKRIIALGILAAALPVFVGAQSTDQKGQNQTPSQTLEMMGQMTSQYQQMSNLMDKLMHSVSAMEGESNSEALEQELADHGDLLKQMQAQMIQEGKIIQNMSSMMNSCMNTSNNTQEKTK